MTKDEFSNLEKGDIFEFHGVTRIVTEIERYSISPTQKETYSITDQFGYRALISDAIISEFCRCSNE